MYKGVGVRFADFTSFFLNIQCKWNLSSFLNVLINYIKFLRNVANIIWIYSVCLHIIITNNPYGGITFLFWRCRLLLHLLYISKWAPENIHHGNKHYVCSLRSGYCSVHKQIKEQTLIVIMMGIWLIAKTASLLTLKAPITKEVVCFCRLRNCLRSIFDEQWGPRSDCLSLYLH